MSSIVIKGDTSGQIEIAAPAVAGTTTLTLPTGSGNIIKDDGSGNLSVSGAITGTGGIYLGGTASANLLDDYEEGTFTATWTIGGTTIATSDGFYVKIGNLVSIHIKQVGGAIGAATGNLKVSTPFTAAGSSRYCTGTCRYNNLTNMGTATTVNSIVSPGAATIYFQSKNAGSYVTADLDNSNINTTLVFYSVDIVYQVS